MKTTKTLSIELDVAHMLNERKGEASAFVDEALRMLYADTATIGTEKLREWGPALEKRSIALWNELQDRKLEHDLLLPARTEKEPSK